MNRRVGIVALVLLLLLGALGYWRFSKKAKTAGGGTGSGAAHQRVGGAQGGAGAVDPASGVPLWFGQFGVAKRKIAGKVMHAGKPVAGATVRLAALIAVPDAFQAVAELKTDANGAFDFGPQLAATFDVSAEADQLLSVSKLVEAADPKAKTDQIVLTLGDCKSRMYGTVLDASGGPIAKARIFISGLAGAESDAAGKYSVCTLEADSVIRIAADGYGALQIRMRLTGELQYDFVLVPEAVLVGQVVTNDKQPVAGARVVASPDPGEGPHHLSGTWASSDADGRFRISGLSPGHYRVGAAADGLASRVLVDAIAATGTSRDVIVVLDKTARLSGHVVMGDKPVAGARVTVPQQGVPATGYSQEDGSFVVDHVLFGSVPLAAPPYEVKAPKTVEVKTAKVDNLTIDVAAMGSITGRVLRHGRPVFGADVNCQQVPGPPQKSGEDGEYALLGLPPGVIHIFVWDVPGHAFSLDRAEKLGPGETKHVDIELDRAGTASGVVVDEMQKPVQGVYVRLITEDGTFDMGDSMTDVNGKFECNSMAGGDYTANVYPTPMAGQAFAPATGDHFPSVKVPQDGLVSGITLSIKNDQVSIKGSVTDDTGAPVADVHIEAIGRGNGGMDLPSIMSRADGTFEIRRLARGTYALHAHGSDGSEADVANVSAPAEGVAVHLIRPGALEGTLEGFSQTPEVSMMTVTTNLGIGTMAIVEGNRFSARGIRPGRYAVEAKAGLETDGATVDVKSGETAKVALKSRGMGKLDGHVLEFGTKTPLAGWQCDANLSINGQMGGAPGDPSRTGYSDEKGHFAMAAPLGKVRVFCFSQAGGYSVAGTDVDVTSQAPAVAEVYAVPNKSGAQAGDAGFRLKPIVIPLVVNDITPGSAAATQGLKVDDVVVSIDGQTLQGVLPMGALFLIANHKPGTVMTLAVDRGGTPLTFKLPITAAPN